MKRTLPRVTGLILTILLALPALRARAADAPVAAPYAEDRALLSSDVARFEWHDTTRDRDVPVKIYYPTGGEAPFPVIVFSHGLGGTREAYEYLARQWTAHGYVSVHLQHPGSDDKVWRTAAGDRMSAMRAAANGTNAIDRAKDVSFAIDQLQKINDSDEKLKGKLDLKHIGISGHSFGAQTSFLSVGQKLGGRFASRQIGDLADPRISCAVPMSATVPANRADLDAIFGDIKVPVFLMTGTEDTSPLNDTQAADRRLPYDHLNSTPAYLLILTGGDHMVFSGRLRQEAKPSDDVHQKLIRLASTAFFDTFLKSDQAARAWLDGAGLKDAVGRDGTVESK